MAKQGLVAWTKLRDTTDLCEVCNETKAATALIQKWDDYTAENLSEDDRETNINILCEQYVKKEQHRQYRTWCLKVKTEEIWGDSETRGLTEPDDAQIKLKLMKQIMGLWFNYAIDILPEQEYELSMKQLKRFSKETDDWTILWTVEGDK